MSKKIDVDESIPSSEGSFGDSEVELIKRAIGGRGYDGRGMLDFYKIGKVIGQGSYGKGKDDSHIM